VTGFEFHLTLLIVKKIKHLRMQIAARRGKIYANPQPDATKILVKDRLREHPACPSSGQSIPLRRIRSGW